MGMQGKKLFEFHFEKTKFCSEIPITDLLVSSLNFLVAFHIINGHEIHMFIYISVVVNQLYHQIKL